MLALLVSLTCILLSHGAKYHPTAEYDDHGHSHMYGGHGHHHHEDDVPRVSRTICYTGYIMDSLSLENNEYSDDEDNIKNALQNPMYYPVTQLLDMADSQEYGYELLLEPNKTYTADDTTYFRGYKIETGKSYIINQAEKTDVSVGFKATVIGEIEDCGIGENNGEMKILHVFHVDDSSRSCEDMAHDEVLNHYICSTTPLEAHEHGKKKKTANPFAVAIFSVATTLVVVGIVMGAFLYETRRKKANAAKKNAEVAIAVAETPVEKDEKEATVV